MYSLQLANTFTVRVRIAPVALPSVAFFIESLFTKEQPWVNRSFAHKKRAIRSKNQRANSQPCFLYNAFVRFIFVSLLDNVQFIFNRTEPRTTGSALSQWANTISATVLLTFSPFFSSPGSNYIFSARSRERAKPTSQEKPNKQSHKTITKQKKQ